jgi:hypothetical protein
VQQSPRQSTLSAGCVVTIIIESPLNFISLPCISELLRFLHPYAALAVEPGQYSPGFLGVTDFLGATLMNDRKIDRALFSASEKITNRIAAII